jgi:hypothetical protein
VCYRPDCDVRLKGRVVIRGSKLAGIAIVALLPFGLAGCWEENLEKADFNAYFYHPKNEREEYLGLVRGLSACQKAAWNRASSLNMSRSDGWSYICCKRTSSSSCESKHK